MQILGLGGLDHNGSITLSCEGQVSSFLEAERPSRIKNVGLDSESVLDLLLDRLPCEGVRHIGVADQTFWDLRKGWLEPALHSRFDASLDVWPHHDCHCASAIVASPWNRALCVSVDGKGDELSAMAAVVGRERGVEQRILSVESAHSLGRLWWAVSEFCGFPGHHSAGKTMALGAFGRPFDLFGEIASLHADGSFTFKAEGGHPNTFRQVSRIQEWIGRELSRRGMVPEEARADVAASLQALNTRVVTHLVREMVRASGIGRVCLAGGVALNGLTNQHLIEQGVVEELFVVPCCDDRGLSLGAAALTAARHEAPIEGGLSSPFLGPEPDAGDATGWRQSSMALSDVAERIKGGAVIGWYSGRDEAGPRALGHRSLLATPTQPGIRDRVNAMKGREPFRPFGCAVDVEAVSNWFQLRGESPFMLRIVQSTEAARTHLPAVLHTDGTSRIQTVHRDDPSTLGPLLDELAAVGHPRVILNTSLNGPGEPLAHTSTEAADIAGRLGADLLVISGVVYEPATARG